VVGVDLGGTNVRACVFNSDGEEAGQRYEIPSHAQNGTEAILDAVAECIGKAIDQASAKPKAVGIAIPGHIDNVAGIVRWAPNLGKQVDGVFRYWENVDIRGPLTKRIGIPVQMGNDANLAALGEYRFGSGKDSATCLVLITVGTGIGGGVVMAPVSLFGEVGGPVVLLGGNQGGAELGHLTVLHGGLDCNAGSYGALEAYCQRDSIVKRALHKLRRGRKSSLPDLVGGDLAKISPKDISDAAHAGDEVALEVWEEVGTMLGVGIGSVINVFAPQIVAVGGQIAKVGEPLLGPARKTARNVAVPSLFKDATIVEAEKGDDAGMLGAAALATEFLRISSHA